MAVDQHSLDVIGQMVVVPMRTDLMQIVEMRTQVGRGGEICLGGRAMVVLRYLDTRAVGFMRCN